MTKIYLCPSPDLYHLYHRDGAAVVVTDIFRATTTMTTAIANGALGIRAVATTEECEAIGTTHGYLMAAERNVRRCPFAQLGNDPYEYTPEVVSGKYIVMTTTNGTRSLSIAREHGAQRILAGSFLNLSATIKSIANCQEVIVLAAGWQGQVSMEDSLYAGALAFEAERLGLGHPCDDSATMMTELWRIHGQTLTDRTAYLSRSEHYTRLQSAGYAHAVEYCLSVDTHPLALELDSEGLWITR